uniref:Uncharacterized protein n=1 Tax=Chryseobacterium endophyticum TaxID=1854762 RepID=A0AAU6WWK7_9FLAO
MQKKFPAFKLFLKNLSPQLNNTLTVPYETTNELYIAEASSSPEESFLHYTYHHWNYDPGKSVMPLHSHANFVERRSDENIQGILKNSDSVNISKKAESPPPCNEPQAIRGQIFITDYTVIKGWRDIKNYITVYKKIKHNTLDIKQVPAATIPVGNTMRSRRQEKKFLSPMRIYTVM